MSESESKRVSQWVRKEGRKEGRKEREGTEPCSSRYVCPCHSHRTAVEDSRCLRCGTPGRTGETERRITTAPSAIAYSSRDVSCTHSHTSGVSGLMHCVANGEAPGGTRL